MARRSVSSPSALVRGPPSVAPTYDKALHTPELPTADPIVSAIRHWHNSCWRVFTI